MARHFVIAVGLGIVGLLVGLGIVTFAVSTWTQLSGHWINSAAIMPILGLMGGFEIAAASMREGLGNLRALLALMAVPLATIGNYLAFVITSRTWFADRIPPEHQGFIFQVLHPSVLPTFATKSRSGSSSEETYFKYMILGAILGPVVFYLATRQTLGTWAAGPGAPRPEAAPEAGKSENQKTA